jgi:hypothetical protein
MSSILVTKILSDSSEFANRTWYYNFREITNIDKKICEKNANSLSQQYSKITKEWSKYKNSEWICRIYFAAKMILHTTLQLLILKFSDEKNIRLVNSYLKYYALLSSCRAIIMTLPTVDWNEGKITELSHKKIINLTFDHIKKFDLELAEKFRDKINLLKAHRELITYRAPTNGDYNINNDIDITELCTLIVELAQFNSEILETSIQKNIKDEDCIFMPEYIKQLSIIKVNNYTFFDREDSYRLNYLRRKWSMPPNILHSMTEGHTEDFFGVWEADEDVEDIFTTGSPRDRQIIFDIP